MNVNVTRRYRGKEEIERSSVTIVNSRAVKNTTLINNILKSATTEVTPQSFIVALNFKDLITFEYKCSDDLIFLSQLSENGDASILQNEIAYVYEDFIAQYEVIKITPNALGMILLMGEYKL